VVAAPAPIIVLDATPPVAADLNAALNADVWKTDEGL
jgi:hypothetical protein